MSVRERQSVQFSVDVSLLGELPLDDGVDRSACRSPCLCVMPVRISRLNTSVRDPTMIATVSVMPDKKRDKGMSTLG